MPKAGYCDQCGANVWLSPDGSCPSGHGARHVSGVYDAPAPVSQQQAQPYYGQSMYPVLDQSGTTPPAKSTGVIIAVVIVGVLLIGCLMAGILSAISIPVFNAAKLNALRKSCFANERTMEGAAQSYNAEFGKAPTSIDAMVGPDNFLKVAPKCPSGGTYSYDPTKMTVTCSVHGSFETYDGAQTTP